MSKKLYLLIALILVIGTFSSPFSDTAGAQGTPPNCEAGFEVRQTRTGQICAPVGSNTGVPPEKTDNDWFSFLNPVKWLSGAIGILGGLLLRIVALVLALTGWLFDAVLKYTIVDMAKNLNDSQGIGGGINAAWSTLRDIGNMVFIFVLLWAAIQLILGLGVDMGKTIKNIIIVGLLINFSLFFTKVVIDASNIPTIGFYQSIVSAGNSKPIGNLFGGEPIGGFTAVFMRAVGIQSTFGADFFNGFDGNSTEFAGRTLIVALLGATTMLVMSVVFLVATVLFISRFILLIFLLILSPIALVGYALPGLSSKFKEWWKTLVDQAFFAPFFMLLTWVAIQMIAKLNLTTQNQSWSGVATQPAGIVGLLLNYTLVIGLIIAALILSKKMASSTFGFTAIAGGVATAGFGTMGFAGRNLIGRRANAIANDEDLRARAARGDIGARMKLATAKKLAGSSFDVRGIGESKLGKIPGIKDSLGTLGKPAGKGGFTKTIEEKATREAKYAKETFGQTSYEKAEAARLKPEYEKGKKKEEARIKDVRNKLRANLKKLEDEGPRANIRDENMRETDIRRIRAELDKEDKEMYSTEFKNAEANYKKYSEGGAERQKSYAERIGRGPSAAIVATSALGGPVTFIPTLATRVFAPKQFKKIGKKIGSMQGNQEAMRKIKAEAGGKSREQRIADMLKEDQKEKDEGEKSPEPETPTDSTGAGSSKAAA